MVDEAEGKLQHRRKKEDEPTNKRMSWQMFHSFTFPGIYNIYVTEKLAVVNISADPGLV